MLRSRTRRSLREEGRSNDVDDHRCPWQSTRSEIPFVGMVSPPGLGSTAHAIASRRHG